jgi:hypothetical protein
LAAPAPTSARMERVQQPLSGVEAGDVRIQQGRGFHLESRNGGRRGLELLRRPPLVGRRLLQHRLRVGFHLEWRLVEGRGVGLGQRLGLRCRGGRGQRRLHLVPGRAAWWRPCLPPSPWSRAAPRRTRALPPWAPAPTTPRSPPSPERPPLPPGRARTRLPWGRPRTRAPPQAPLPAAPRERPSAVSSAGSSAGSSARIGRSGAFSAASLHSSWSTSLPSLPAATGRTRVSSAASGIHRVASAAICRTASWVGRRPRWGFAPARGPGRRLPPPRPPRSRRRPRPPTRPPWVKATPPSTRSVQRIWQTRKLDSCVARQTSRTERGCFSAEATSQASVPTRMRSSTAR